MQNDEISVLKGWKERKIDHNIRPDRSMLRPGLAANEVEKLSTKCTSFEKESIIEPLSKRETKEKRTEIVTCMNGGNC